MNWLIPAKTFLLGEYAAIAGESAIVLTTTPCFEVSLSQGNNALHPDSPAGQWLRSQNLSLDCLYWFDPYQGKGGMGASSAQFIGAYLASCHINQIQPDYESLLNAYYQCAWQGKGLKPSGYDVLAQTQQGCVYINKNRQQMHRFDWLFPDIAFLLIHSGQKLATHHHLQSTTLPTDVHALSETVEQAKHAFEHNDSHELITAITTYQQQLASSNLTAPHSLQALEYLQQRKSVLAAKGCGALGADVLLLIVSEENLINETNDLTNGGWHVLATSKSLFREKTLIENNPYKALNFSPNPV